MLSGIALQERGQALTFMALAMVALMGSMALAMDGSNAYAQRRRMQNAADAAALAGARAHATGGDGQAVQAAIYEYAELNGADLATPDSVSWSYSDEGEEHVGVVVTTTATFPTSFARVIGYSSLSVRASAEAEIGQSAAGPAFGWAMFANNPTSDQAIMIEGNNAEVGEVVLGTVVLGGIHSNGGIYVDGNNNVIWGATESVRQFSLTGNNNVIDSPFEITASGGYTIQGQNNVYPSPNYTANLEDMPQYSLSDYGPSKPDWVPDEHWHYHSGDLTLDQNNETWTGVYYVEGDITLSGNHLGGQVTFVTTGSILVTGENYDFVTYDDKMLFFANSGDILIGTTNSNSMEYSGIVYAPQGRVGINGNCLSTPLYGSIIADTIEFDGNNTQIVVYKRDYFEDDDASELDIRLVR